MFKFEMNNLESNRQPTRIVDAKAYEEDGNWYLSVSWEYTDSKGRRMQRTFPKLSFPVYNFRLPTVCIIEDKDERGFVHPFNPPKIIVESVGNLQAYDSTVTMEDGTETDAAYFDICIDDGVKEMTLEEIEKIVGHRVKIVSEKEEEK